jgi:hypothetical protein
MRWQAGGQRLHQRASPVGCGAKGVDRRTRRG